MVRRWLLLIVAIAFAWLVFQHRAELGDVARTLARGRWAWVATGAAIQIAYYLAYAGLYRASFATVGVDARLRDVLPVLLGALVLNALVPGSGAALFVDDAARRGQSRIRAAAGLLLTLAVDLGGLALLLLAALAIRSRHGPVGTGEFLGTAVVLLAVGAASALFTIGMWRPPWIRGLLSVAQAATDRIARLLRRSAVSWAERAAAGFVEASAMIRRRPLRVAGLLARSLLVHLLDVATLGALFVAFGQPISIPALVAGYALGLLAWIVSPVPQGIGIVEATFALVYASFGVPGPVAAAIALAFRGLTFWIPLGIGFLGLRRLRSSPAERRVNAGNGTTGGGAPRAEPARHD